MPLRLPRPPAELVDAFEAEMTRTDAVTTAIAQGLDPEILGTADSPRVPQKHWLLGGMPVEGLPRGSKLDRNFPSALKTRCWRFFVALDDGGHVELDYRGGTIIEGRYIRPGERSWLDLIARGTMLWAMETVGNDEARLLEFPWINIRAVRATGPDSGYILDELWDEGDHGVPMTEEDFIAYVLRRYIRLRNQARPAEASGESA